MSTFAEMNRGIIDEFRANQGKVGGIFEGADLLILTTMGAKSGKTRENPVMYRKAGDRYVVFASMAGADANPSWYHNVKANPDVTVEVGTERFPAVATELEGDERDRLWEAQKVEVPQFAEYERTTDRVIPVVVLVRS